MRIRVRDVLRGRLPRPGDDRGNIAMVMMVVLVGATIGALLMSMILNQNGSTRFDSSRVRTLDGAQAGIDVMLGQIRHATTTDTSGKTFGDDDRLPCGSFSGSANGTGSVTYTVTVAYYSSDPARGATAMNCAANYGPYDAASGSHTPKYAKITSFGQEPSGASSTSKGRTLTTTYVFQTDDVNIPGGQIQIYPDSSGNTWCMDAGSAVPNPGTSVLLQACSTSIPVSARQVFAYRTDLSIRLVSSVTTANPNGLCLDTSPTAHASGVALVLLPCAVVDPNRCSDITRCSPGNQQWSLNSSAGLEGSVQDQSSLDDKSARDNFCITVGSQSAGVALLLQSPCAGGVTNTQQTWVLAPSGGAGMAGAGNSQLVNFLQFSTCLDVTNQDPRASFLILYNCKQDPNPKALDTNQLFAPSPALGTAPTQVLLKTQVPKGGLTYCLTSPLTPGGYPIEGSCPAGVTANTATAWTMYQSKDASGNDLPYAQKYTIVDAGGNCLGLGRASDKWNAYLKAVVTTCDGSTAQKWNADPSVLASRLTNTGEN